MFFAHLIFNTRVKKNFYYYSIVFFKILLFLRPNYFIAHLETSVVTVLSLRPVKEKMLQLVVNRKQATDSTQHVHANGVTTETIAVVTTTNETQTEPPTRVLTSDSAIQIDLLPCTGE